MTTLMLITTIATVSRIREKPRQRLRLGRAERARALTLLGVAPGEDRVPGALENLIAGGMIEDNSVRATATTMLNADAGYAFADVRIQVSVLNLLDERASDIQYYYASRLQGEAAGGVNDVHFHPVEPRQVRVSLVLRRSLDPKR